MRRYLIETSIIIEYLRRKNDTVELIDKLEGELTSSVICLAELYEGIYRSKDYKKAEEGVLIFFKGLSEVYGLDQETAKEFGRIRTELKIDGKVIEDLDIFLAATCIAQGLTLVIRNHKHFERVNGLSIKKFGN